MSLIEVRELTKKFAIDCNEVLAVDNISLSIEKGDFVAITGESGAGKSTLFYLLAGLDSPSSGEIIINNKNITRLRKDEITKLRRQEIGIIYQFYNLISILTVEENILLPMQLDNKKIDRKKLDQLLTVLNLLERRNHLPNQLSGGQQQRVSIARALFYEPSLILADEPTGNLDSKNSDEFMNYLENLNKMYNQTILLITHSDSIAKRAKRIIKMKDGRIVEDNK